MRRGLPGPGERLAPALSGLLLAASFPPLHLLLPPFVALVPFAIWVARRGAGPEGAASAVRGGLLLGVVTYGLLLHWLVPALWWVDGWRAVPLFAAVLGVLATLFAGVGWTLHRAVHRASAPLWLVLPVVWTAGEWVQAHLPGSLAFPWLGLGTALTGFPELVGIAELVGAPGVTFWLATVNGVVAGAVLGAGRGRYRLLAAAVVVVLVPAGWGLIRSDRLPVRNGPVVLALQTAAPAGITEDAGRTAEYTIGFLERMAGEASGGVAAPGTPTGSRVRLAVLPEGAVVAPGARAVDEVRRFARTVGAPVLVGWYEPGPDIANTAVVIASEGPRSARYVKQRPVPFVEADPWTVPWPPGASPRGAPGGPLPVDGVRYAVLICYESAFPDLSVRQVRAGAEVILNLTNDAWYGAPSGGGRTVGLDQHPAHLVMRAIETRRGAVRIANGGPSFFLDPVGRVHDPAPAGEEAALTAAVRTTDLSTLYTRTGDWVGPLSVLAALVLVLRAARSRSPSPTIPVGWRARP